MRIKNTNIRLKIPSGWLGAFFIFLAFSSVACSCRPQGDSTRMVITGEITPDEFENESVRKILYNLYKPEEMSMIFERAGANFNPSIPASPDDFPIYSEPSDIATALGVYGVDLFYTRLFEQAPYTAKYLLSIEILAEKLKIPGSYYEGLFEDPQNWIDDKDSVSKVASEIYMKTDAFLKKNGQEALASLIIMGSWVEAMYIASSVFTENPANLEVLDRVIEQKYSLNNLINVLSNHEDNLVIHENLLLLRKLRRAFDQFEIYFEKDKLTLDTINKQIIASEYHSTVNDQIINEILWNIKDIRMKIISP